MKNQTWIGIILLPDDYLLKFRASENPSRFLDEIEDATNVVFWSQDRAKIRRRLRELDGQDLIATTIEQDWDPQMQLVCDHVPDSAAMQKAVKLALGGEK